MASKWRRSNGLTIVAGEERIRAFLKSLEEEEEHVDRKIEEENNRLETCKNAIYNLQLAIADGRKIFKCHEENLMALQGLKTKSNGLEELTSWTMRPESTSETLCTQLKALIVDPISQYSVGIERLTALLEKKTQPLREEIGKLELELEGWKTILKASTLRLDNLRIRRIAIENEIRIASQPFQPILQIPTEIWAAIFRLVKEEELRDYMQQNDMKSLRSIAFVLSHICRRWRSIVAGEHSLWNLVYAPPVTNWRQDEYDLLTSSAQKCNGSMTLLTNAYQAFPRGYDPTQRHEKDVNTWASVVTPDEGIVFPERKYTLHINTQDDQQSYMQRLSNIPFKQPSALILSSILPFSHGFFFSYVKGTTVKSFTIINANPKWLLGAPVDYLPRLTMLRIHVKDLPTDLAMTGWLLATLEELYLHRETGGVFPTLEAGTQLPNLRILGITSASTPIIQNVSMPDLRTLIMYGTSNANQAVEASASTNADQIYRRLTHLRLEGWGEVGTGIVTAGAASMLAKVVSKTLGLHTIEFLDSFLDGGAVVRTIASATRGTDVETLKHLKEITLNNIIGITRDQCDELKGMVAKLNVYV